MNRICNYKNTSAEQIKSALEMAYDHEQGLRSTLEEANMTTRTLRAARHCATLGAWPGDIVTHHGNEYRLLDEPAESMFCIRGVLIKQNGKDSSRASNLYVDEIKLIEKA